MAKTVAVLMGGLSAERPVSLRSGNACADALEAEGYEVLRVDVDADIAKTLASTGPASTKHPGGQPICRKHHLQFCGGWCNRVHHICPRKMGDGSYCFGHHTLRQCIERNP